MQNTLKLQCDFTVYSEFSEQEISLFASMIASKTELFSKLHFRFYIFNRDFIFLAGNTSTYQVKDMNQNEKDCMLLTDCVVYNGRQIQKTDFAKTIIKLVDS